MKGSLKVKDIAAMANVSVATVSRVINQNGRYSQETERRVRDIIKEYNYLPNQNAKGLRRHQIDAVAIIMPDITNEFYSKMVLTIQNILFENGVVSILFNTEYSEQIEARCIAHILAQNVRAIVAINSDRVSEAMIPRDVKMVYVDSFPERVPRECESVFFTADHEYGAYLAGRELIDRGSRKLMMITSIPGEQATEKRIQGFKRACEESNIVLDENMILEAKSLNYQSAYKIMNDALKQGLDFDGVFCQTDWLASGALAALIDNKIAVPDQVRLIGFDDISISSFCIKPFSTIHQPITEMGKEAANTILAMLSGEKQQETTKVFPVTLVRRETT